MTRVRNISLVLLLVASFGCAGVYRGTITLTAAVDSAAQEYATIYKYKTVPVSEETHSKVLSAHARYQQFAGVAYDALLAYKLSGDATQYQQAFEAARSAGLAFANLVIPFFTKSKAESTINSITNAKAAL